MLNENSSDDDLIGAVFAGIKTASEEFARDPKAWMNTHGPIPTNIPLPDGAHIWVTKEGQHAARMFGRKWLNNNTTFKAGVKAEKVEAWAVEAFGKLIAEARKDSSPFVGTEDSTPILKQYLTDRAQNQLRDFVHYFSCFVTNNDSTWDFGPVKIFPRSDWLDAVRATSGGKSDNWIDAVKEQWLAGGLTPPATTSALPPREQVTADTALRNGPGPSVAKVTIQANEISRSIERARIAASLAIESLRLIVDSFSAHMTLRAPEDHLKPKLEYSFVQEFQQDIRWGSSLDLPTGGVGIGKALSNTNTYIKQIGEMLEAITNEKPSRVTPELDLRWLNALYWFGKARRETSDFISVAMMGMTLDILTEGKKAKGIRELLEKLFGTSGKTVVLPDGRTRDQVTDAIYAKVRSQYAHGGILGLLAEMPVERPNADILTATALYAYFDRLGSYAGSDNYNEFFKTL